MGIFFQRLGMSAVYRARDAKFHIVFDRGPANLAFDHPFNSMIARRDQAQRRDRHLCQGRRQYF
jgi:hypothetical protein